MERKRKRPLDEEGRCEGHPAAVALPKHKRKRVDQAAQAAKPPRLVQSSSSSSSSSNNTSNTRNSANQRRKKKRSNRVRHDVLQSVFPSCQTLHQFLLRFKDQAGARPFLLPTDTPAYRSLVTKAVVAVPANAPPLPVAPSMESRFRIEDIVLRVVQTLCRAESRHLLAKGYRKGHGLMNVWGVEIYYPNMIVNIIKTPTWQALLSRIGDELMAYLLMHTFMFLPLPHNCYMQITGPSLWLSGSGSMMEEGSELQQQELWSRKDRYLTLPSYASRAHRRRRKTEIFDLLSAHGKRVLQRRPHKRRKLNHATTNTKAEHGGQARSVTPRPAPTHSKEEKNEEKNEAKNEAKSEATQRQQESKKARGDREKKELNAEEKRQAKVKKHRKRDRAKRKERKKMAKAEEDEQRKMSAEDKNANHPRVAGQKTKTKKGKEPRLSMWRRRKEKKAAARADQGDKNVREGTGEQFIAFACDSDDPVSEGEDGGVVKGQMGAMEVVVVEEENTPMEEDAPAEAGLYSAAALWLDDPLMNDQWRQAEREAFEAATRLAMGTTARETIAEAATPAPASTSTPPKRPATPAPPPTLTPSQVPRGTKKAAYAKLPSQGHVPTAGTIDEGNRKETAKATKRTKTKKKMKSKAKKKMPTIRQKAASAEEFYVPRSRIFYANPSTSYFGLPPKHTLNRIKCTKMGARRLLREMFVDKATYDPVAPPTVQPQLRRSDSGLLPTHKLKKVKNVHLPKSLRGLLPLAMHIIRRHEKTKKTKSYSRALHRHCPIPTPPTANTPAPQTKPRHDATATKRASQPSTKHSSSPLSVCGRLYTQEGQKLERDAPADSTLDHLSFLATQPPDLDTSIDGEQAPTPPRPTRRRAADSSDHTSQHEPTEAAKAAKGHRRTSEAIARLQEVTSYSTLFSNYCCTYRQVASFVKAVLSYLLPATLWGSKHNVAILAKSVDEFVRLRRHDRYSVHSAMSGLRLRDMTWLRSVRRDYKDKQRMVQRLLSWVYAQLIIPLLRIHFYVTESGQYGKRIFYYRKPVWAHIYRLAMAEFRRSQVFSEVPLDEAKRVLVSPERQLGFSFIRFLPKNGGVRPIVNLKRKPTNYAAISVLDNEETKARPGNRAPSYKVTAAYVADRNNKKIEWSINTILRTTFFILRHAKDNNPEVLGASVFSYNDVYVRLSTFLNELRQERKRKKLPRLYFVSMDIKSCFNNINQHKVYEVVDKLLKDQDEYLVYRVITHMPVPTLRRIVSRPEGRVMPLDELPQAYAFARDLAQNRKDSIITDQVVHITMDKSETMELLKQHLFDNLVVDRMDDTPRFYRQTKGIAQGSVLSTLLCSLVYGDLENSCFKHLSWDSRSLPTFYTPSPSTTQSICATPMEDPAKPKGVLVRLIDDFLYITTNATMAKRFVLDMHKGYPSHGCTVNTLKTQVNFDMSVDGKRLNNVNHRPSTAKHHRHPKQPPPTDPVLSWCGLLINTRTLQIRADYTRYEGTYIAEQLTRGGGGRKLWVGILHAVKPKCHPLLLDSRINQPEGVALNVYQVFTLCAIKFYCQVKAMPRGADKNPAFFLGVIFDVVRYMWMLAKSRTSCGIAKQMDCRFCLSRQEVLWLGYKAFATVLQAKQTQFSLLLPPLATKTKQIWRSVRHNKKVKQRLAYATDPHNSEVFKLIRY